ncbi:MAG: response regulator, partial [candidate division Zixibacteria bacterium]|nr:response regulator [candidate division Zixibacteria bacterium]
MPAKIFIADDSSTIRGVAESLLRQKGYEVYSAPDKNSAINLINETKPDLILLDSSTPEPDGLSICKTLRKNEQFLQVPIVILAGTEEAESIANSPDHGETETMMKPFTPRELNETVEKLISREVSQEGQKVAEPQELEDFSPDATDTNDERLPWETTSLHLEGIQDPQRNEDKTENIDSTTESGLKEIDGNEDEDD